MRISLITASWNSAATIGDTLRSVAEQTYPNIEHILVDGGSRDDTMAVVEREGKHLARTVSEPDKGIYDAYNKGLKLATGEVIGFINSDDYYASPTVIAEAMKAFEDPTVEAVHADLVYVDQNDTSRVVRYWRSRACTRRNVAKGFHPAHPTLFLRRSVYERCGDFDLGYRIASDVEFMMRIFHKYGVNDAHVPRVWVRMRTGGATGGSLRSIYRQNREVRNAQRKLGIYSAAPVFFFSKVADRIVQRLRGRFPALRPTAGA